MRAGNYEARVSLRKSTSRRQRMSIAMFLEHGQTPLNISLIKWALYEWTRNILFDNKDVTKNLELLRNN